MAELYNYQRHALQELTKGKRIIIAGVGSGKSAMAMKFVEHEVAKTGKRKALIVTTASKARTNDFQNDADLFCPSLLTSLSSLSVISWHKLGAWVNQNWGHLDEYIYVFDEIQRSKGYSTGMGKAFLKITKHVKSWAGFTATPGDSWDAFISYFTATGQVRNKTQFMHDYAITQTFKGFPEIVGWRQEDRLKRMWSKISYAPDISQMLAELPAERHKVVSFKKPAQYIKTLKTRQTASGELLDTSGALCAELRRLCFTKEKRQWVSDFIEGLGTGAVVFYNFIKTGDELEQIITKALPKSAKVWRIDGKHHEIPTADTIGERDIVLCQWQSGSEALNLQFLNIWLSVEPHYSYSTSVQARGRIKRIGQKRNMQYWYLKTEGTIESAIYKVLSKKSEFSEANWCIENNIIMEGEEQ